MSNSLFRFGWLGRWLAALLCSAPLAFGQCSISFPSGNWFGWGTSTITYDIAITGTNCAWTVTTNAAWVHLGAPTSGVISNGSVSPRPTFTRDANNTGLPRVATITVTANGTTASFHFVQNPVSCSMTLTPTSATVNAEGGDVAAMISTSPANCYGYVPQASFPSWMSGSRFFDPGGTSYPSRTWYVDQNPGGAARSITLPFTTDVGGTASITINQNAAVSNDESTGAVVVGALPYTRSQSTLDATYNDNDPILSCYGDVGGNSVWYRYVANFTGALRVNTFGSNYDTVLSAYVGSTTPGGEVACDDGTGPNFQADMAFQVQNGQSYLIQAGSYDFYGGNLSVNAAACGYSISPNPQTIAGTGATSTVTVTTQGPCPFTATSNAPWITVNMGSPGAGTGTVGFTVLANPGAARSGTITIGTGSTTQTLTINQGPGCISSIAPPNASVLAAGGGGSVGVSIPAGCAWTATSNATWITVPPGSGGTGNGNVNYTVAANTGPSRSGTVTIAGQTFTVNQDYGCTFTPSPASASVGSTAGTGSFSLVTGSGCGWGVSTSTPWISVTSSPSNSGPQTVTFSYQANTGPARSGTITISFFAAVTFTLNQGPSCPSTVSLSASSANATAPGGNGSVNVTTTAGCPWNAVSNAPWITFPGASSGSGNGTLSYNVATNAGPARSGTITVGGQTFTVTQAEGCASTITPTSATAGPSGSTGSVSVTTAAGCAWNATANVPWITWTSGASGNGNGSVGYSVAANTGPARSGTANIAGQTFTVNQDAACLYSLSAASFMTDKNQVNSSVNVTTGPSCTWTASSPDSWVTIGSGGAGTGNGTVNFAVSANSGGSRSVALTIAGQPFLITQTGAAICQASLNESGASVGAAASSGSVVLTMTGPECAWTVSKNAAWITIRSAASGAGTTTVNYDVAANTTRTSRTGTLTIAGLPYVIRQASPDCSGITLSQSADTVSSTGGTRTVSVSAPVGCSYSATSSSSFLSVTGGASGNGPGTVSYNVQQNTAPSLRKGTLTIANQTYTVTQAGDSTPSVSCAVTTAGVSIARSTGRTELAPDIIIDCTGRTGGNSFSADVTLTLNGNFTSRIVQASNESTEAALTLTGGGTFAGRVGGANIVRFANVPLSSGEPTISLRMRISKVRADVSVVRTGTLTGVVAVRAPVSIPVVNANQTLATIQTAVTARRNATAEGTTSAQRVIPVVFQEAVSNAFRTRDGESGDTGTRLRLRLAGLPGGAQIFAPAASQDGKAKLVSADDSGFGGTQVAGSPRAGSMYQAVTPSNGVAIMTWEVTASDPTTLESLQFPVLIENAGTNEVDQVSIQGVLAPLSNIVAASSGAPIPRFADPNVRPAGTNLRILALTTTGLTAVVNTTMSFRYKVFNDSDQNADGVIARNILADGLGNPTCMTTVGDCTVNAGVIRFNIGTLGAGLGAELTVNAAVGGVGNCPNCGASGQTGGNPNPNPGGGGTGGLSTCPNCLGNGSVGQNQASVESNQEDPDLSNNTVETPVEFSSQCSFSVSRGLLTAAATGSTLKVDVTTGPTCDWELPPLADNFVSVSPAGGSARGSLTLTINVTGNPTGTSRSTTVLVAGTSIQITQLAQGCTTTPSVPGGTIPASGGSLNLQVTTGAGCAWTAVSAPEWVKFSAAQVAGVGPMTVPFTVLANPAMLPRGGFLEVGGQTLQIMQGAAPAAGGLTCNYSISPGSVNVGSGASTGTVNVTSDAGCFWSATSGSSWIAIVSGGSGSGSGTVTYSVQANPGAGRSESITVAGQSFAITQAPGVVTPSTGLRFVAIPPCRVMETRAEYNFQGRTGPFGPPFLQAGETRTLTMANSNVCQIPPTAKAYVLNATLVPRGGVEFVTIWPGGESRPTVWSVRSPDGQVVANSAIVKAGSGAIQVYSSNPTDLLLDISGYYTDDTAVSNQAFYPLTPCRVIDTRADYRTPAGPFGPPTLNAGETRRFRFPATPYCSVPSGATAYSVTITAVPQGPLQYLTAWPAGGSQPNVSNINSPAGRVLANSVILPASADGSVDVFVYDKADFLIDINGYFAPDNGNGLFYFPVTQCRVSDSRNANGTFGGPIYGGEPGRSLPLPASACTGIPGSAKAYAVNVTAIPNGAPMPFITAWPTGQVRPNASVLNAFQGQVVTNLAIVPAGANGALDVFALTPTHVVVEVNGYFGR